MVLGFEVLLEHFKQERFGAIQLVLLVLQLHSDRQVVIEDLAPGVEQVDDPVLDAPQTFLPLGFVSERLLAYAGEERLEELALKGGPHPRDLLDPPGWS